MTIVLTIPVDKMEDVSLCITTPGVSVNQDLPDPTARSMLMNAECTVIHVVTEENVSTHLDHTSKFNVKYT